MSGDEPTSKRITNRDKSIVLSGTWTDAATIRPQTGTWNENVARLAEDGSMWLLDSDRATITIPFEGTGIDVYGLLLSDTQTGTPPTYTYTIDTDQSTTTQLPAQVFAQEELLNVVGLSPGKHTLVIDFRRPSADWHLGFDYAGMLLSPSLSTITSESSTVSSSSTTATTSIQTSTFTSVNLPGSTSTSARPQSTLTPTTINTSSPTPSPNSSDTQKTAGSTAPNPPIAAIVGAVIGVSILALLILLYIWLRRRRQTRSRRRNSKVMSIEGGVADTTGHNGGGGNSNGYPTREYTPPTAQSTTPTSRSYSHSASLAPKFFYGSGTLDGSDNLSSPQTSNESFPKPPRSFSNSTNPIAKPGLSLASKSESTLGNSKAPINTSRASTKHNTYTYSDTSHPSCISTISTREPPPAYYESPSARHPPMPQPTTGTDHVQIPRELLTSLINHLSTSSSPLPQVHH
ncbi:hypothetical protein DFP72DRAFT_1172988 [Ephemerocybe angulata]|uniref:Uncharacterized protein n=1 Tax=Ephemerocybe angulata TaxID=980116 RepID=A0A8H6HPL1_9AGAR|nr:hypothetical protein DFP72DRAFT_1172988 [Tulosesus angulatus]